MCNLADRQTDEQLVQAAQELEEMTRTAGWARLKLLTDKKLEAIKEALCKADPTNAAQIASLQAQARECGYFFKIVEEEIARGHEAAARLSKEGAQQHGNGRR